MPYAPKRPCRHPGCKNLCDSGVYCKEHQSVKTEHEMRRGTRSERGYTYKWYKARDLYLRQHPLCEECLKEHRTRAATVIDHVIPHRGDPMLFWDTRNWQALCKQHHDKKTGSGL